ncbi:hypothetical protein D3C87_1042760 [compost metagenome]
MKIPAHLALQNRYWRGTLHLFVKHCKLQRYLTTKYFDFEEETIDVAALKRLARPWSQSERFILHLALHLFNENLAKVNLSDMDCLDDLNKQLVLVALRLRF